MLHRWKLWLKSFAQHARCYMKSYSALESSHVYYIVHVLLLTVLPDPFRRRSHSHFRTRLKPHGVQKGQEEERHGTVTSVDDAVLPSSKPGNLWSFSPGEGWSPGREMQSMQSRSHMPNGSLVSSHLVRHLELNVASLDGNVVYLTASLP
jgi:hypothetical protein